MKAIIVDIDGTLALRVDRSPFDWSRVGEDTPNQRIIELVWILQNAGYKILLFSGRDEQCRSQTLAWLIDNKITYHNLYMRPKDDNRKDAIIKKELYDKYVKGKYEVHYVLDDRNQVVDMWRNELQLTCLQVAEGNF